MKHVNVALGLLLALCALGCATGQQVGKFTDQGFLSKEFPMYVKYSDASSKTILGPEWIIDNLQMSNDPPTSKVGVAWESEYHYDADGDGSLEGREKLPRYFLLLRHKKTDAKLWIRFFPISTQLAETEPQLLLQDYIDAASGAGTMYVLLGQDTVAATERRFATRTLDMRSFRVADMPAASAVFELANVDQLQLAADSRWERAQMLLVRVPWQTKYGMEEFPMVMLAGYTNRPERFAEHAPKLAELVAALRLTSDDIHLVRAMDALKKCAGEGFDAALEEGIQLNVGSDGRVSRAFIEETVLSDARVPAPRERARRCMAGIKGKAVFLEGRSRTFNMTPSELRAARDRATHAELTFGEAVPHLVQALTAAAGASTAELPGSRPSPGSEH